LVFFSIIYYLGSLPGFKQPITNNHNISLGRNMKFKPIYLLLFLFLSVVVMDCNWLNRNIQNGETTPVYESDTLRKGGFETDAKVYESADRVIWQKPDLVIDQLGKVEGKIVADLGAGTGYFSRRIAY